MQRREGKYSAESCNAKVHRMHTSIEAWKGSADAPTRDAAPAIAIRCQTEATARQFTCMRGGRRCECKQMAGNTSELVTVPIYTKLVSAQHMPGTWVLR